MCFFLAYLLALIQINVLMCFNVVFDVVLCFMDVNAIQL